MNILEKFNRKVLGCLIIITVVSSVPLMTDYVFKGASIVGTLSQIRVLSENLGNAFPLRIAPAVNIDYGYGAGTLQANIFLLPSALLYRLGMELGSAYKWACFLLNMGTAVIGYLCVKRCFGSRRVGLIGSMLFTWCPGRCSEMYLMGELGETAAWTFLPLILLGYCLLFDVARKERDYGEAWVALVWGYSLVALSSTVVLFAAVVMSLILLLVMGKETLQKERLLALGKMGIVTVLVNAWILVPALLRMREVSAVAPLIVNNVRGRGMYISQYVTSFNWAGDGENIVADGLENIRAMGPGIAVILLLFGFCWIAFTGGIRREESPQTDRRWHFLKRTLAGAAVLVLLSLNIFPWDLLQNRNMICSILLAVMHTPAKLGIAADICLIFAMCVFISVLQGMLSDRNYKLVLLTVAAVAFGTTQFLLGDILQTRHFAREAEIQEMSSAAFSLLTNESLGWRFCEMVSIVALLGCLALFVVRRRRSVKKV